MYHIYKTEHETDVLHKIQKAKNVLAQQWLAFSWYFTRTLAVKDFI